MPTKIDPTDPSAPFDEFIAWNEDEELWSGKKSQAWHDSPEGGTPTFGYGHKMNVLEKDTRQVYGYDLGKATEADARAVLKRDLGVYEAQAKNFIGPKWDSLPKRSKEMLMDMHYNVGLERFPSFVKGVLKGDLDLQRKEYKRYYKNPKTGRNEEVKKRNDSFYKRYLSSDALKKWGALTGK